MNKNLIARITVAALTIPIILWISYKGGIFLMGMVTFFAVMALYEYFSREGVKFHHPVLWLAFLVMFGMFVLRMIFYETDYSQMNSLYEIFGGLVFLLIAGMAFSVGTRPPHELFTKYTRLFWGLIYIGGLYPFVFHVGQFKINGISGGDWLLLLFGILWIGDTAAMFVGKAFGKHKLAPAVSPNKTVEGFIGGLIGAVLIGLIIYYWKLSSIPIYHILLISLGASLFGQMGDLVESMWKRSLNIKDSSNLIPGHGGILDRFDSLLFAAPFVYFYIDNFL